MTTSHRIALEQALPQLARERHRQVARHLADRPGWSTTDRIVSELCPYPPADATREERNYWRIRRDATKREIQGALRRLQAIGFIRYDDRTGGWWR